MAKKPKIIVKLHIPGGQANPGPPIGPALAPHGVNISEFCKKFNDLTKNKTGWTIPVEVKIFEDKSFEIETKEPPTSELLKKAAGIEKGSGTPRKTKVGKITREQLKEIAKQKMLDLNIQDLEKAIKIIEGTAKSMGITIE